MGCSQMGENLHKDRLSTENNRDIDRLQTGFSTEIFCEFFPRCPGCKCQKDVQNPPVIQRVKQFFPALEMAQARKITSWRSKVKLAVRGSAKDPKIGLFEKKSHSIVDIPTCPLHYPLMNQAISYIKLMMSFCGVEPYQEESSLGRLRYLQMFFCEEKSTIQLALVFNGTSLLQNEHLFIEELKKKSFWHSIWINFQPGSTNTILGKSWELVFGQEDFFVRIKGISFCFHPSSFAQAHIAVFEDMIGFVEELIDEGASVLELYAGVGCMGLCLAGKASHVTLIESSPYSSACFEKTTSKMESAILGKCLFLQASVEEGELSWDKDVILVDPPRKGLSHKCKEKIFSSKAKNLIYVSCGVESFIRDSLEFLEKKWVLHRIKGFLLFPGADHIELVASFKRR
jgi:23S rRNA (uracil1939-C5)-methyltransferase